LTNLAHIQIETISLFPQLATTKLQVIIARFRSSEVCHHRHQHHLLDYKWESVPASVGK